MTDRQDGDKPSHKQVIAQMLGYYDFDPPIGAAFAFDDPEQSYRCVGHRIVERESGIPYRLFTWESQCVECGVRFTWESRRWFAYAVRGCPEHSAEFRKAKAKQARQAKLASQKVPRAYGNVCRVVARVIDGLAMVQSQMRFNDLVEAAMVHLPDPKQGMRDTRRQVTVRAIRTLASHDNPIIEIDSGIVTFRD